MSQTKTITTKSGVELTLRLVSPLLINRVRDSVPLPERPTYTIPTIAGATETHPHDETTLETEDDRAAWKAYFEAKTAAEARRRELVIRAWLMRGIEVEMPTDDSWVALQQALGVEVPCELHERRVHWLVTEVLLPQELTLVLTKLMGMGKISEEDVAAAEDSFRGVLGRARGDEAAGASPEGTGRGVVALADADGGKDSALVGDAA